MTDKPWKAFERRVARFFGTIRTPLSGGNSKHTRSDSLHDKLFIDCKRRKSNSKTYTEYLEIKELAEKEQKVPVLVYQQPNHKGFLICVHSTCIHEFAEILLNQQLEQ